MRHFFTKLSFCRLLTAFLLTFISLEIGLIEHNQLKAEYYGRCPGCGKFCYESKFCNKKSKISPQVIHLTQNNQNISNETQASREAAQREEQRKQKENEELLEGIKEGFEEARKDAKKRHQEIDEEIRAERKKTEDFKKKLEEEREAFEKELQQKKAADKLTDKILKETAAQRKEKEKELNELEREREEIAKEKLENEERLTRSEDEEFNGGKERKSEIDSYIEKLKSEGKENIAQAMEEFLQNPHKAIISEKALDFFGDKVRRFDYRSRDIIDNTIVDAIGNSADILQQLQQPGILNSNYIIDQLKNSLVTGNTSLARQADYLSSQNDVKGALNTTSLINTLSNLAQGFATGYYERVDGIGETINSVGASIINAAVTIATNPQVILEKVGCMMMEAVSPDTLDVMAAISPRVAERREELHDTSRAIIRTMFETVQSASTFVGKVQDNIVEFAKEYGPAFSTADNYIGLPEQVCKTMMAEQQVAQQKLREAVSAYAAGVTAKGVGEVIGSVAADCATTYFGGKIAGKIGEAVSSSTKNEAVCAAAREIEAAALPAVTPAVQELPIATQALQEASGAQQVLEEIYKYNHGGLTPVGARELSSIKHETTKKVCSQMFNLEKELPTQLGSKDYIVKTLHKAESSLQNVENFETTLKKATLGNNKNFSGTFYEVETALKYQNEGHYIEGLNLRAKEIKGISSDVLKHLKNNPEFDVITKDVLVECKNYYNWTPQAIEKIKSNSSIQNSVAQQLGRKFVFNSRGAIPNELKEWFTKKNINFCENYEFFIKQ